MRNRRPGRPGWTVPEMEGHSGKVLSNDGERPEWVDSAGGSGLPDMTGQSGEVLSNDGTNPLWMPLPAPTFVSQMLSRQFGRVVTPAGAVENVLFTYTFPAGWFNADGKTARIRAWWEVFNSSDNKIMRIYVGGSLPFSWGIASTNMFTTADITLMRTASNTLSYVAIKDVFNNTTGLEGSTASGQRWGNITYDLSTALVVNMTGRTDAGTNWLWGRMLRVDGDN